LNNPLITIITQNATYIIIAMVSLLFIYIIVKLLTRKKRTQLDEPPKSIELEEDEFLSENEVVEDPFASSDDEPMTPKQVQEAPLEEDKNDTEQTFESNEAHLEPLEIASNADETPKQSRKKREFFSKHKSITKDNFKEFSGKRVLVAEDNLINQKVIKGLLADSGIEIVLAEDGQIVLDILEKDSDFEIILMDAHMPRVDGLEASRIIRKNPQYDHIAIAALSGDTAADDKRKMSDAGMDEQLEKPLKVDALYELFYTYFSDEDEAKQQTEAATKNVDEDFIVDTAMDAHLDVNIGLQNCANDQALYLELLQDFITSYGEASDELSAYLAHDNFSAAAALLLDIKGLCDSLGASYIANEADNLRVTIIDNNEKELFDRLDAFKTDLTMLIKEIQIYSKKVES